MTDYNVKNKANIVKRAMLGLNNNYNIVSLEDIPEICKGDNKIIMIGIDKKVNVDNQEYYFLFNYLIDQGIDMKKLYIPMGNINIRTAKNHL